MKNRKFSGLNTRASAVAALLMGVLSQGAQAQGNYYDRESYRQEAYISIYEHCDFKGERRDIAVGDFASMRELDFDNDSMSSIQVPRELEAIIFEHDRFKGDYARVDRDVRCFDGTWNDQVSSLKVVNRDRRGANRSQGPSTVYGGSNSSDDQHVRNRENSTRNSRANYQVRDGVTGLNVKQVVFDGKVLQKIDNSTWQIDDSYAGIVHYTEVVRDRQKVELKNKNTSQRILLNLTTNQAFVNFNSGNQKSYKIDSRIAGAVPNQSLPAQQTREPSRYFPNECFNFKAYTDGKTGSIRFAHGKEFIRLSDRVHKGKFCHRGLLIVEMGKRDFDTDLTLEIDGRVFKFASGEKETKYRSSWFRKVLKLQVGT